MDAAETVAKVLAGDIRAASRLMRWVDDGDVRADAPLKTLYRKGGQAFVLGVTGSPGAGKSTLTDRLVSWYRAQNKSVGVIAVDPTSSFTGGAILGDRIRMQRHATDPQVFIRSLATRGNLGGLSKATADCVNVMDAMGREVIIIETVGVGQDEIDIAQLAHCTAVVLVPGMGDDIQAIKAGILEVADVFVVNKADLDGADRVVRELRGMLELRHAVRAPPADFDHDAHHQMVRAKAEGRPMPTQTSADSAEWEPLIIKTVASRDDGVKALGEAIATHQTHLKDHNQLNARNLKRAEAQFLALLKTRLLRVGLSRLEREAGKLNDIVKQLAERKVDPYALADQIASG